MDQQVVRIVLSRLDNSLVTMSERMMPEPDAFAAFQSMAKELTGREIKERPLEVRPASVAPDREERSMRRVGVTIMMLIVIATGLLFSYELGYRRGYEQGGADVRRAYGSR